MTDFTEERLAALAELRTWLGTKWQHQGRLKGRGVDCIGLVIALAKAADSLTLEDENSLPVNYSRLPHKDQLLRRTMDRVLVKVSSREEVLAGDVLLAAWRVHPTHLLVVSNSSPNSIVAPFNTIHSEGRLAAGGCVVEQPLRWDNWRITGYYRLSRWA